MTVINQKQVGQLGNQLFQNAHFTASAIEHGFSYLDPVFGYPLEWFPAINSQPNVNFRKASDFEHKFRYRSLKMLRFLLKQSSLHCFYDSTQIDSIFELNNDIFLKYAKERLVFCEGFKFREYIALKKHNRIIKKIFSPNKNICEDVDISYKKINPNDKFVLLGVHIRRADYRQYLNGKYYFSDREWMDVIQRTLRAFRKFNMLKIIIFSDENVDEIARVSEQVHCISGTIMHDLNLMAKMDYLLGPPSTFSGWSSFFGDVPILHLESLSQSIEVEKFEPILGINT